MSVIPPVRRESPFARMFRAHEAARRLAEKAAANAATKPSSAPTGGPASEQAKISVADIEESARARERKRMSAIMNSDAAARNPESALIIAARTEIPAAEAISLIRDIRQPAAKPATPQRSELATAIIEAGRWRRGEIEGEPGHKSKALSLAMQIIQAGKDARGEK